MIEVKNLSKAYGSLTAVDDISFEINKGEAFGLLGPNGAGKTTTINMLVGILNPDSGEIKINGNGDPAKSETRRGIGNCPQTLALYDDLTAEENLRFFGKLYNLSRSDIKMRVDYALEFAGLNDRRAGRVKTFSGGMKRRLNLACSLIHDPQVILMDEPTVGVDPQSRNQIFNSIEKLKDSGKTIIYTTHYMEEAQRLCDRVAIIDSGKILALDTVDNLIKEHGGISVLELQLVESVSADIDLPGKLEGNNLRIETENPAEKLAELSGEGLKFFSAKIKSADLETVFLNLTGRSLRDK